MERKTNWIALIVCVVVGMGIGFLWYGVLFVDIWAAGNNITFEGTDSTMKFFKNGVEMSSSPAPMIFNMAFMVVYALLMNWLLAKTGATNWLDGAKIGALIGLVLLLNIITGNMFAMNPFNLSIVDGSYSFLMFVLFGAIIGGWQKR